MALYTLTLRTNFEHILESIVYILYIVSKLGKLGVQRFKRFANRSWNGEVIAIWRQLHQVGGSFRNDFEIQLMISKFNLWFWNPLWNDTNFEFTHRYFDVPSFLPRELHLFNLWIRNPLWNDTNFEFTHYHFDVPPPLPRELHLFNLWIRKPLWNDTNFEFTYCHFDVSPPVPRELRLRHFIHPKWTPHN